MWDGEGFSNKNQIVKISLTYGTARSEVSGFGIRVASGGLFIEGALDAGCATPGYMSVDHSGFHVFMPKEFLNCANVVVVLQEMSGKAMAQGVRGDMFVNVGAAGGFFD